MNGSGRDDRGDERLLEMIRDAYGDVRLPVPIADIRRRARRPWTRLFAAVPARPAFAAAAATAVLVIGVWAMVGPGRGGEESIPLAPPPSSASRDGKPPRPTSTASTAAGRCADQVRAELGGEPPPLRLSLALDRTGLLVYATEDAAVTCWLSGDQVTVGGSATAVDAGSYPPGRLSYRSEDSGRDWGGGAFGRAPVGTTRVTISFPSGPDVRATVVGEWFGYLAPPGQQSNRMAEATRVTAVTPAGEISLQIMHG